MLLSSLIHSVDDMQDMLQVQCPAPCLTVQQFSDAFLHHLCKFCYGVLGEIDLQHGVRDMESMLRLLKVASKYALYDLVAHCERMIYQQHVNPATALTVLVVRFPCFLGPHGLNYYSRTVQRATEVGAVLLRRLCMQTILDNFAKLAATKAYTELDKDMLIGTRNLAKAHM